MNSILKTRNVRALTALDEKQLSQLDKKGRTALHYFALQHDLDMLFACICLGCKQNIRDKSGKTYSQYLHGWENTYIRQRCEAFRKNKIWVNVYRDSFEGFIPHGYSTKGVPMLSIVWEHDLGIETLIRILDAGIDLDHHFRPPVEYAKVMASYGWVPETDTINVDTQLTQFYPPEKWSAKDRDTQYTVKPIGIAPFGLFNKSIVFISDTHWEHRRLHVPGGDVLVCSGDLCMPWIKDLTDYLLWMGKQAHPHKILVAGNHDKLLQRDKEKYLLICEQQGIVYLEDSGVEIDGIKFWGSPWTPKRPKNKNNAFTLPRKELMEKWNLIPADTNVLITHCPPYGIGDCNTKVYKGRPFQGGDYGLYKTINRLKKLKIHAFGHQHFGRGLYKGSNRVYFVNSAIAQEASAYVFH